jgi:cytochrome c peroxidase
VRDLDALAAAVRRLERVVATASDDSASLAALRDAFTTARARYKRVEFLAELFTPTTADLINGPVLDEMAEDDPNQFVIPPEGFQVVEEQLYSGQPLAERDALRTEVHVLLANVTRMRHDAAATPLTAASVWDAMRLQLARLVTLGLAGFDSPFALRALPEGAEVVRGLRGVVAHWMPTLRRADTALADTLDARLTRA